MENRLVAPDEFPAILHKGDPPNLYERAARLRNFDRPT